MINNIFKGNDINLNQEYVWESSYFFGTVSESMIFKIFGMVKELFYIIRRQILASITIQRAWHLCRYNPDYYICRRIHGDKYKEILS